ncbi:MAG: cytosolic protein [Deltaproteobacteria bacterium]|nr:cytosolic protein [Deltaproteobacteria bacterium]
MGNGVLVGRFEELSREELVRWVMEGFRRTLIHYGCWFREVEYQLGMEKAVAVEREAGDLSFGITMKRLSGILGFELEDGMPKRLKQMKREELLKLLDGVCVNWLANDGVWFQAVEKRFGMDTAKRCNDTCWSRYSPYEALRIKELLGLSEHPGLEGLKAALGFRMYARINKQSMEDVDAESFIFRMNDCRVQSARKRKGLADYPCKSGGMVEYPFFASAIDSRIETECVGCPPDAHPDDWYCAWKFTLKA